jgi:hypothetical protein
MRETRQWNLDEVRGGLIHEKVTALEIDVGQIPLIDWERHAGFGTPLIDHASRIFIRPSQKRALENKLAAFSALDAFAAAVFYHLFDILRSNGAEDEAADLVCQP